MSVLPPHLDPRRAEPARRRPSTAAIAVLAGASITVVVALALVLYTLMGSAGLVFGAFLGLTTVLAIGVIIFSFGSTGYQALLSRLESHL